LRPGGGAEVGRESPEDLVSGLVAADVVDVLEVVEVDHEHGPVNGQVLQGGAKQLRSTLGRYVSHARRVAHPCAAVLVL
jgi:hypothetical protein